MKGERWQVGYEASFAFRFKPILEDAAKVVANSLRINHQPVQTLLHCRSPWLSRKSKSIPNPKKLLAGILSRPLSLVSRSFSTEIFRPYPMLVRHQFMN
ncbi:MAG TPA: hypothetical protein DIT99_27395 [Candidatus Latescibacteria bacterium]|nr:hypothetical protein [Candidatus Latescibacterota bacterium]